MRRRHSFPTTDLDRPRALALSGSWCRLDPLVKSLAETGYEVTAQILDDGSPRRVEYALRNHAIELVLIDVEEEFSSQARRVASIADRTIPVVLVTADGSHPWPLGEDSRVVVHTAKPGRIAQMARQLVPPIWDVA